MSAESSNRVGPITLITLNIFLSGSGLFRCSGGTTKATKEKVEIVLSEIAELVKSADIVALQEVDRNAARSFGLDGDTVITGHLGDEWKCRFSRAKYIKQCRPTEKGKYGNSILTKMEMIKCSRPKLEKVSEGEEDRSAVVMELQSQGHRFTVINLHLGLRKDDQESQISQLMSKTIKNIDPATNIILCGDFNTLDKDRPGFEKFLTYTRLLELLNPLDSERKFVDLGPAGEATHRIGKIDYIFLGRGTKGDFSTVKVETLKCRGRVSDHNAIKLEFTL